VFKLKRDEVGAIIKHKARLVAHGFMQREGIDFDDTFASMARMKSVRLLFALATQEDWRIHHMDVKTTFLNGCDTPIKITRANNVLKYQSLDQSLVQYIIQVVHSRTTLLFKYKTHQHDDDTN
jgi:hypothetical protein